MNDRQLHELLRMAAEVEEIEAHASSTLGQISPWTIARGPRTLTRTVWAGLSVAAAIALGAGLFVTLGTPGGASGGTPGAHQPGALALAPVEAPVPAVDPVVQPSMTAVDSQPATPGMLLAIYQDILGAARCVQVLPLPMNPGESLADVARADILHAEELGNGGSCASGPHRLLVVALAGPSSSLPDSDASAEALASCIASSRDQCSEMPSSYANAAAACVPPGVSVRVESTLVLR
jgi:hypothetical protein